MELWQGLPPEVRRDYAVVRTVKCTAEKELVLLQRRADGLRVLLRNYPEEAPAVYALLAGRELPHMPRILACEAREGGGYVLEEFIEGRCLGDGPLLEPQHALRVLRQTCEALAALHALGVVHRDVKPENLLETPDGQVYLLDFDAAERKALTAMLEEYELPHDAQACEVYHKVNRELWDALAKGKLGKSRLFQIRFQRFLQAMELPDNGKSRAMNDRYEELLATHADLIPGALNALEELGEVATLATVSNGATAVQQARIRDSGLEKYMDGIYISEKIGAAKPSAKLFEHVLKDLGITNRSRVLMVGDDLLADIKGGQNAGLDTCWVNFKNEENDTNVIPKYEIHSYEELYKLVMEPEELENIGIRNRRHSNEA